MTTDTVPPPIYSQEDPDETAAPRGDNRPNPATPGPQILIIPTTDAVNFQKGYLGADGERAAIEGELQIKGTEATSWGKVLVASMTLRGTC